ncbi:MAG: hypothetical protein AAB263_06385 [Planctomycetota bacterium]
MFKLMEPMAQLSLLPSLTSAAVVEPSPFSSSSTVTSWQLAVGSMSSSTVMVVVQVCVLELPSVTVRVTVFAPRS